MTRKTVNLNIDEEIGQRIREKRTEKKLTQEKVGEILGMTPQNVSAIELGKIAVNVADIIKLSDLLDTTPDELLLGYKERRDIVDLLLNCRDREYDVLKKVIVFTRELLRENVR